MSDAFMRRGSVFKPQLIVLYVLILSVPPSVITQSCLFSLQSGWRDEDHEYGEAAKDHPHHSEPDGRAPRFQREFEAEFQTFRRSSVSRISGEEPSDIWMFPHRSTPTS